MNNSSAIFKVRLVFLSIAVLFVLFSIFGLQQMHIVNQKSTEMEENWLPSLIVVNAINTATSDYRTAEALHALTTDHAEIERQAKQMKRILQEINTLRKKYEKLVSSEEERSIYQAFVKEFELYLRDSSHEHEDVQTFQSYIGESDILNEIKHLNESGVLFDKFSTHLTRLVKLNEESALNASRSGDQIFSESKTFFIGIDVAFIVLCIIFIVLVQNWMTVKVRFRKIDDAEQSEKVSFLNKLTIKTKLRLDSLLVFILIVLLAWLALDRIHAVNEKSTEIEVNWLPSVVYVNAMNTATSDLRIAEATHILTTDEEKMLKHEKEIKDLTYEIGVLFSKYSALISSEEEQDIYNQFIQKYGDYLTASDSAMKLSRDNKNAEAAEQLKQSGLVFHSMSAELVKLVELNERSAIHASHQGDEIFELSISIMIGASLCALILAILKMFLFESMISRPLARLTNIIQELAEGNISDHEIELRYDEIGYMAQSVQKISTTLDALINDSLELIHSAQLGILSARIDAESHPGKFAVIVTGMNELIEVLNKPLVEIAEVMQQLALGHLDERIKGNYEGDLQALKTNVNRSLESLVNLLSDLVHVSNKMALNDLTCRIESNYQGDFSALKVDVNHAVEQIQKVLVSVASSTEQMSTATVETVDAANHVVEQSSNQMNALDEIASAITQSSANVSQIADSAKDGEQLSRSTAELATVGKNLLLKLVEIIEKTADEYNQIEQITGKITRIADKTHLLSLNAGLEAVRAGEHGLGFGFVAQQIGKLAEEASSSAKDIGSLIANSTKNVELSVGAAKQTQKAIEEITQAASESGTAVQSISSAIVQQSSAIEWISEQVSKNQSSGQENTEAAIKISNTMAQLAKTVDNIYSQIQTFKLS